MFGAGLALMALLAMRAERRPGGIASTCWPILAFLIGLLLFIPVESQTRTYTALGWTAVLRTLIPDDPAHWVRDWLDMARAIHVIQHKVGSAAAMLAGAVELGRARGWLRGAGWRHVLPVCLVAVSVAFGIHGGDAHHLPFHMEQSQHHLMGVGFGLAGVSVGLHRVGVLRHRGWALTWPVLALLAGLAIALFYRLPSGAAGHLMHAPASAVPPHAGGER
jgi:hypothetical protein